MIFKSFFFSCEKKEKQNLNYITKNTSKFKEKKIRINFSISTLTIKSKIESFSSDFINC